MYATDNGPEGYDELNLVRPGRDYGYPSIEGGPAGVTGLKDPLWDSAEERLGITGLTFYAGSLFPEYAGDLFFCAFNTGALRRVRLTGPDLDDVDWVELISHDCRPDITNGPDGTLYFSDLARTFRLSRQVKFRGKYPTRAPGAHPRRDRLDRSARHRAESDQQDSGLGRAASRAQPPSS